MRLAGIQPGYLPWLGYFDQMRRVDVFVVADEMQFSSTGWAHRNRVRSPDGAHWLTLPARPAARQAICDVPLDTSVPWAATHLATLRNFYAGSPFAPDLLRSLASVLHAGATRLVEATVPTLRLLATLLGVQTPLVISSEAGLERAYEEQFPGQPGPTHRIIAFMKTLGATELLEGESGRDYLDVALCAAHGIEVTFQRYAHPLYAQRHAPFVSHLSALDLLLCRGEREARRVLASVP
ncbi:MAG: WbqC family protein [Deltaproteobacteria bacterium]|nr:WbqC family protein [Deltaproteobacteria bacterium]